jgi:exportin-2 (importin alpha re-exporter)
MEFRDSDEEDFEDTPMDYVRKDLEGSDFDTRRRAASDFVKILCNQFEQEVTSIFSTYVNLLLAEHKNNPKDKWKSKDTAISLVIALVVKTSVQTVSAGFSFSRSPSVFHFLCVIVARCHCYEQLGQHW